MLQIYNVAYSCKNAKYPIDNFVKITLLNDNLSLNRYSKLHVIETDTENILFSKSMNGDPIDMKNVKL